MVPLMAVAAWKMPRSRRHGRKRRYLSQRTLKQALLLLVRCHESGRLFSNADLCAALSLSEGTALEVLLGLTKMGVIGVESWYVPLLPALERVRHRTYRRGEKPGMVKRVEWVRVPQ